MVIQSSIPLYGNKLRNFEFSIRKQQQCYHQQQQQQTKRTKTIVVRNELVGEIIPNVSTPLSINNKRMDKQWNEK